MKSKGPVDFLLGVFLEFGAAFCLLFFLPQVPWHWVPAEDGNENAVSSRPELAPSSKRQETFRLEQTTLDNIRRSQFGARSLKAPSLLPPEPVPAVINPSAVPLPANMSQQPKPPAFRRDFPRPYRY